MKLLPPSYPYYVPFRLSDRSTDNGIEVAHFRLCTSWNP